MKRNTTGLRLFTSLIGSGLVGSRNVGSRNVGCLAFELGSRDDRLTRACPYRTGWGMGMQKPLKLPGQPGHSSPDRAGTSFVLTFGLGGWVWRAGGWANEKERIRKARNQSASLLQHNNTAQQDTDGNTAKTSTSFNPTHHPPARARWS